jgi:hypothetical protein
VGKTDLRDLPDLRGFPARRAILGRWVPLALSAREDRPDLAATKASPAQMEQTARPARKVYRVLRASAVSVARLESPCKGKRANVGSRD